MVLICQGDGWIASSSDCQAALGRDYRAGFVCHGYNGDGGTQAGCGDSGGPLFVGRTIASEQKLAGVVSWGYNAPRQTYSVYIGPSSATDWIKDTMVNNLTKLM